MKAEARAVVLCKDDTIIKVYENIGVMAKRQDISLATALYKVQPTTESVSGYKFWFEDQYLERHPDDGAALKKAKEDMIMADAKSEKNTKKTKKTEKAVDNELDATPTTEPKKGKRKMKKVVPTEVKMETKKEPVVTEAPKTKPNADMVNHPAHYCNGDIECWDAMMAAFGEEWMMHYANVAAFKYNWRAKHKGKFAEDMRKAAWYNTRAAELEEKINGE
ncbi:MAG: DUF3310 domain-containing protein [Anaerovibrio sp.]|uniref:DUF3310 domain-containing protein n=1 Tax=Anaerovibrio sp. TaxID=1872532 RepID=UPI0025E6CBE7|nr:DUF3310 domain-containing protein [Anaerovibrio sp.]MCR5177209.1 DUF3310 domain-containing protein [Anaerovibrio sp.]